MGQVLPLCRDAVGVFYKPQPTRPDSDIDGERLRTNWLTDL